MRCESVTAYVGLVAVYLMRVFDREKERRRETEALFAPGIITSTVVTIISRALIQSQHTEERLQAVNCEWCLESLD